MSKIKCDRTYKTRIKGSASRLLYLTDKDNYKAEKKKTDTINGEIRNIKSALTSAQQLEPQCLKEKEFIDAQKALIFVDTDPDVRNLWRAIFKKLNLDDINIIDTNPKPRPKPKPKSNKSDLVNKIVRYLTSKNVSKSKLEAISDVLNITYDIPPKKQVIQRKHAPVYKPLENAIENVNVGEQIDRFRNIKIIYSCIIQNEGSSSQQKDAKEIIDNFENDVNYRKLLFTNHIKYLKWYNAFKKELKKVLKLEKFSNQRNMMERSLMGKFWEPGSKLNRADDYPYHIGGSGKPKEEYVQW